MVENDEKEKLMGAFVFDQKLLPALFTIAVCTATAALADPRPVEVAGAADSSPVLPEKPPQVPFSTQFGLTFPAIPEVRLPAVDTTALLAEDAATDCGGKCLRYGIGRDISVALSNGQWVAVPNGGQLWVCDV